jgi:hypothetical protein
MSTTDDHQRNTDGLSKALSATDSAASSKTTCASQVIAVKHLVLDDTLSTSSDHHPLAIFMDTRFARGMGTGPVAEVVFDRPVKGGLSHETAVGSRPTDYCVLHHYAPYTDTAIIQANALQNPGTPLSITPLLSLSSQKERPTFPSLDSSSLQPSSEVPDVLDVKPVQISTKDPLSSAVSYSDQPGQKQKWMIVIHGGAGLSKPSNNRIIKGLNSYVTLMARKLLTLLVP